MPVPSYEQLLFEKTFRKSLSTLECNLCLEAGNTTSTCDKDVSAVYLKDVIYSYFEKIEWYL